MSLRGGWSEDLHGRRDEDPRAVVERALIEVEALVVMRMHDPALLVPRADEEERARRLLLVRREVLAAHCRRRFDERIGAERRDDRTTQQLARARIVDHRAVARLDDEGVLRA